MESYKIIFNIYSKNEGAKEKLLLNDNKSRLFSLALLKAYKEYMFNKFKEPPTITVKYLNNIDITCYTYSPLNKNYIYQITFIRNVD